MLLYTKVAGKNLENMIKFANVMASSGGDVIPVLAKINHTVKEDYPGRAEELPDDTITFTIPYQIQFTGQQRRSESFIFKLARPT